MKKECMCATLLWRLIRPLRTIVIFLKKIISFVKKNGFSLLFRRAGIFVKSEIYSFFLKKYNKRFLNNIVANSETPVIVYPPYHDFNHPIYQRPQHLSINLSSKFTYLFHTNNTIDNISRIKNIKSGLFLVPPNLYRYTQKLDLALKKILFLYSHPSRQWNIDIIEDFLKKKNIVIYDYLDDLNDEIFGNVNDDAIERHIYLLKNKGVILLVTADALLKEVQKYRPCLSNTYFVPNAVDVRHFTQEKKEVVELACFKHKKVIGYFGALASWVDYELIKKIAVSYPDHIILLLGYIYDGKFRASGVHKLENIVFKGPVKYEDLPNYSDYFDISIIPFSINNTTRATSPIKLFEYMALGKPIITTDLPECRKYKSVLVAKNHDEFISLVDKALKISSDDEYFVTMKNEAQENTWESRAKLISKVIHENLNAV